MGIYAEALELLKSDYPDVGNALNSGASLYENLLAHGVLNAPRSLKDQAESVVRAFDEVRNNPRHLAHISALYPELAQALVPNFGALMSYDFHVVGDTLKLIEVNTNASSGLIVDLLYRTRKIQNEFCSDFRSEIIRSFTEEFTIQNPNRKLNNVIIVDENPEQQKLFIEFQLYRSLFKSHGLECEIWDVLKLENSDREIDLVYNRLTDFFFSHYPKIKSRYLTRQTVFSPHPLEYARLADKTRLFELGDPQFLNNLGVSGFSRETLQRHLLRSFAIHQGSPRDEIWGKRKNYFFKPAQSFGGKAVYKGSSVTLGVFENIMKGGYLAQEYAPPASCSVTNEAGVSEEFKYDLRFYAYKNKIQLGAARLWRGQMTNVHTLGGGLAPIVWET